MVTNVTLLVISCFSYLFTLNAPKIGNRAIVSS